MNRLRIKRSSRSGIGMGNVSGRLVAALESVKSDTLYMGVCERSLESLRWPIGHLNDICIACSVCCVNSKYATKPQWLFYGVAELIHLYF